MALVKHIYGALTEVISANLNDIQDEIIADELRIVDLEALETQEVRIHASAMAGVVNCTFQNITSRYWEASAAPAELIMPVTVSVGAAITAWGLDIKDTASAVTAQLFKTTAGQAPVGVGAAQVSAGSVSDQPLAHTLASPETVVTGSYYFVKAIMPTMTMRVYGGSFSRTL